MNPNISAFITHHLRMLEISPEKRAEDLKRRADQPVTPIFSRIAEHYDARGYRLEELIPSDILSSLDPSALRLLSLIGNILPDEGPLRERGIRSIAVIPAPLCGTFGAYLPHDREPVIFINEYLVFLYDLFARVIVNQVFASTMDLSGDLERLEERRRLLPFSTEAYATLLLELLLEQQTAAASLDETARCVDVDKLDLMMAEAVSILATSGVAEDYESYLQEWLPGASQRFNGGIHEELRDEYEACATAMLSHVIGHELAHLLCDHASGAVSELTRTLFDIFQSGKPHRSMMECEADMVAADVICGLAGFNPGNPPRPGAILGLGLGSIFPWYCDQLNFIMSSGREPTEEEQIFGQAYMLNIRTDLRDMFGSHPTSWERNMLAPSRNLVFLSAIADERALVFAARIFPLMSYLAHGPITDGTIRVPVAQQGKHPLLGRPSLSERLERCAMLDEAERERIIRSVDLRSTDGVQRALPHADGAPEGWQSRLERFMHAIGAWPHE